MISCLDKLEALTGVDPGMTLALVALFDVFCGLMTFGVVHVVVPGAILYQKEQRARRNRQLENIVKEIKKNSNYFFLIV